MKALRVGIIGANAQSGWARDSHVPAVQGLDGLELVAVATSRPETAEAAARAFGVPSAYGAGRDLIADPSVDLVTVATRVPDHRDLVLAAIAAGKHVYCEWSLGRSVEEAEEMAAAARAAGVHTAIGLQLRTNNSVRKARELITSGAIGRVLSVTVYSATAGFGPDVAAPFAYLEEPENFANLVTIQAAHTIDLAIAVIGELTDLSSLATAQYPDIRVADDRELRRRSTFDHLLLQGRLASGGTLSVEVAGGRPPQTPSHVEVVGDTGSIRLDGGGARGVQTGRLALSLSGAVQLIDDGALAAMSDAAANVAGVYEALRHDVASGATDAPGFDHAVKLTRLVTDLLDSSRTGARKTASEWPNY